MPSALSALSLSAKPPPSPQEQYKNVGEEVKKSNLDAMREQLALFKSKLEEFAMQVRTHRTEDFSLQHTRPDAPCSFHLSMCIASPVAAQVRHPARPRVQGSVPPHVRKYRCRPPSLQQGARLYAYVCVHEQSSTMPVCQMISALPHPCFFIASAVCVYVCLCVCVCRRSPQGVWAKTLGFGDFYYELAVQAVEACWATRTANGGLYELDALTRAVNKRRGSKVDPVTADDLVRGDRVCVCVCACVRTCCVGQGRRFACREWTARRVCVCVCVSQVRAIKKLRVLGGGFDVISIGNIQVRCSIVQLAYPPIHMLQGPGMHRPRSFGTCCRQRASVPLQLCYSVTLCGVLCMGTLSTVAMCTVLCHDCYTVRT